MSLFIVALSVVNPIASYAAESAPVLNEETCNNITNGGSIGNSQSGCSPFDASTITNVSSPTGGSGTIEYMWLYKNNSTGNNFWQVSGASSATYNPPALTETTTYRRCSRRSGCSSWDGESNDVVITVTNCNPSLPEALNCTGQWQWQPTLSLNGCDINAQVRFIDGGTFTINLPSELANNSVNLTNVRTSSFDGYCSRGSVSQPNEQWKIVFFKNGSVVGQTGYTTDILDNVIQDTRFDNFGPFTFPNGIDQIKLVHYEDPTFGNGSASTPNSVVPSGVCFTYTTTPLCNNVTSGGSIGSNQSGCAPFNPSNIMNMAWPTGGSGNIEYMWIYRSASTNMVWTEIPGANAASYDPGPLTETTMFRRCARRQWCSTWAGESNIVTITVNQCCSNITDGGEIAANQSGCAPYDVEPLTNVESPSGGSGAIEYMWIYKNASTNWQFQTIPGALSSSYDPGVISETTVFRRCSRRSGCSTWDGETADVTITINGVCIPEQECIITGYESPTGRIFWIPNFGTDFRSTTTNPVVLKKYANGAAHIVGTIERISNPNQRFDVSLYFENESTYAEWVAMGLQAHTPNLGDETTWIYYNWATLTKNTLIGQGSLSGVVLYLTNQDGAYGLQLGDGANALNTNANGISNWFSYTGTSSGHGDLNGTYECNEPCAELCVSDEEAPIFNPFPTEVTVECVHEIPVSSVTATDACDSNVDVTFTESFVSVDADTVICSIFDADTHTLWVSNPVKNALGVTNNNFIVDGSATFEKYSSGKLKISGTVKSVSHPNRKFQFVSHFKDKRTWEEWSAIPNATSETGFRDAKLDAGTSIIVTDEYLDWHYYEMDTSLPNELIGLGALAGVNLQVLHAPANYEYGAQLGENASLQSYGLGFSTWITIVGNVFGTYICDAGDYNFGIENCIGEGEQEFECNDHYQIIRTYTATDNCGNSATAHQVITVLGDTEAPTFDNLPENQTVLCGTLPTAEELAVTATDNCDEAVIVTVTHVDTGEDCEITRTFTFVAEDDCGNQTIAIRVFNTNDNIPPVFINLPESADVECGQLPNAQNFVVLAEDNCAANPSVTFTFQDSGNGCNQTRTITWTATDDCGNVTVATRVFSVEDNEVPVFVNVPADMQMECGEEVANIEVLATDNCDNDVFVDHESVIVPQDCGYLFVRTWTATDDCGNVATASQTITFVDTTNPTVTNAPADMQLECSAIIPFEEPTFTDICDDELEVNFIETEVPFGCTYKIVRRWIATDDCGNEAEVVQTITIVDTTAPVLVNVPSNTSVTCENIPAVPTNVMAEDICDENVQVNFFEIITELACGKLITRNWSAMDDCGNEVTATQTIQVTDNTAPVFFNIPADASATCSTIPAVPTNITATDNCSDLGEIEFVQNIVADPNGDACVYTIVRTWTVADACGNEATATQSIIVIDNTAPTFVNAPANVEVECSAIPVAPVVTATDECSVDPIVATLQETINPVSACVYQIVRTWTVSDACGNMNQAVQTITVTDSTAPTFDNAPESTSVSCGEIPAVPVVTASDACDAMVDVQFFEMPMGSGCNFVINRVWVATDDCGNTSVHTQVITVGDNVAPFIVSAPSAEITISCDQDEPTDAPVFGDACDTDLQIVATSGITNVTDCGFDIEKLWTAIDDCGNSISFTRIIHVVDNEAPVFTTEVENETVSCDAIPAPAPVAATDNCSDAQVTFNQTESGSCPQIITRTWTATDACGNQNTLVQVLTVIDNTPPVFTFVPANTEAQCTTAPELIDPIAEDNCSDVNIELVVTTNGTCPKVITRTWTATDACGNQTVATQTVSVVDNTAPYFVNVPADMEVACDAIPAPANVTALDNCDLIVDVEFTESSTSGFCTYFIFRTWTAIDDCGNEASVTQMLTVVDENAPILSGVPANVTVDCNSIPAVAEVTASDVCSEEVNLSFNEEIEPLNCGYQIIRTWTANDNCGNITVASQVITVTDIVAPIVSNVPAATTIECNTSLPTDAPTFEDACSEFEVVLTVDSTSVGCNILVTKTWTATDECGNFNSVSQLITIVDTTSPVFVELPVAAIEVECDAIPAPATLEATDNCSTPEVVFNETEEGTCPRVITRTWTATDACGNETEFIQTITVVDTTAPSLIGVPANVTVECDAIPTAAVVTAIDNCDTSVSQTSMTETVLPINICTYMLVRTWTVSDACANTASATQMITVVDTTAPVLVGVPANVPQVSCDNIPAPAVVTAEDNCDNNIQVIFNETSEGTCPQIITRTWTAEDACGNEVVATQTIAVFDLQAPVLVGVPSNLTISCDESYTTPEVTATDNCTENLIVDFNEVVNEFVCGSEVVRTWTVADACGNVATATQVITIVDEEAPVASEVSQSGLTFECSDEIPFSAPVFTDNCDEDLAISFDETIIDVSACGYTIVRTWIAADDCENETVVTQSINVVDTTAPVLEGVPANITVACDNIPAPAVVAASDNCSGVELIFNETIGEGCPYTITRTWTATDECGNTEVATQVITVIDEELPVLIGIPADITVECDEVIPSSTVLATDNCTENIQVTMDEVVETADCGATITRTWTAVDNCGNTASASQTITVVDTTAPEFDGQDAELTLECNVMPSIIAPVASDNCDMDVAVVFGFERIDGECENEYTEIYTWTATDDCGNSAVRTYTFNFIDTTAPEFTTSLSNLVAECDNVPAAVEVNAIDNCDDNVSVTMVETATEGCNYTITRVYTAIDNCGNVNTLTQTIEVVDTTSPELSGTDEEITLECNIMPSIVAPTAMDNCDANVDVVMTSEIIEGACENSFTEVYTWTATDDCGNTATRTLTIHFVDTTAPTLEVPADLTLECTEQLPSVMVTADDNCDSEPTIEMTSSTEFFECGYAITRTWTATDNCGNSTSASQTVTFVDTQAPEVVSAPENIEVECTDEIPFVAPVFADACDENLSISFNEAEINVNDCSYTIERVWVAVDACGNETTVTQEILVADFTAPVIVGEIDVIGYCDQTYQALVTVSDNCDTDVTLTWEDFEVSGGCEGRIIRTYTATDNCGNESSFVQIITLTDGDAPVASNQPENLLLECTDEIPSVIVTFTDNCDEELDLFFEENTEVSDCGYTLTRVWRAVDNCNNETIVEQVITVADITNPTLSNVPASVEIECGETIPAISNDVVATDNCSMDIEVFVEEMTEALDCGTLITRIYRAFDDCGNSAMAIQTITITDTQAPVINGQVEDMTVNCENIPQAPVFTAFDVCDGTVNVVFNETMGEGCPYSILRTWTATDACGNETTLTQLISVVDEVNPTFNAFPVWISVSCDEVENYTLTAKDNCDNDVEVTIIEELVFSGGCFGNLQRTYKATDNCGNFVTAVQIIQIVDNVDPVLENVPANVTIYCESEIPAVAENVFATDNCTTDVEVFFTETQTNDFCPYDIIRTWTAIDFCGNETVATQVIHVTVEVEQQVVLNAYPNPANEMFTFEFSSPENVEVVGGVYDVTGREVISLMRGNADGGRLYKFTVETDALNTGTYTIRMIVDGEMYNQRMMITGR